MEVKFRKLSPNAVVPSYARKGDAGLDLIATSVKSKMDETRVPGRPTLKQYSFKYMEYGTGLSVEIPEGYVGLIFPRSSISETCMDLANAVGVIDSGYRGEITFRFRTIENKLDNYKVGDKIGQLVILAYPKVKPVEASELSETERGSNGYGSTGK